jgi:preprotein translocase subunit SecA
MLHSFISEKVSLYLPAGEKEMWDIEGLIKEFYPMILSDADKAGLITREPDADEIMKLLIDKADKLYAEKEELMTSELMREAERVILLRNVDRKWMDHIDAMDELESGIRLQAYGQRDPVVLYKLEGSQMFEEMIDEIRSDTVRQVLSVMPRTEIKRENVVKITGASHGGDASPVKRSPVKKSESDKVGRNDLCPCGSGLKYKKCCGKNSGGEE